MNGFYRLEKIFRKRFLLKKKIRALCLLTKNIFLSQPILLELTPPVNICNDIHGQIFDLLELFDIIGSPEEQNYLFLGDYVDRGERSTEIITLLYACKVKYRNKFFSLRGNHENSSMNKKYGFFKECEDRYSVEIWQEFVESFKYLPLAAVVGTKIFCCHGGISPKLNSLNQIRDIPRSIDEISKGVIRDLLWSDPEKNIKGWAENPRGISVIFGSDQVEEFLTKHNFDLICRGHQVVPHGYEFFANSKLVTIAIAIAENFTM